MALKRFVQEDKQVIFHTEGMICSTPQQLFQSEELTKIIDLYIKKHVKKNSYLQSILHLPIFSNPDEMNISKLLQMLTDHPLEEIARVLPGAVCLLDPKLRNSLHIFVEDLYNFWRTFDRFMILHSEPGASSFDRRPYRSFNATLGTLANLIRGVYRDICENITGDHPRIYRQVAAGCNVGLIAVPRECHFPDNYGAMLKDVPFIRQLLINPPMIINPPMNTRSGHFRRVEHNPLEGCSFNKDEWLCYPAQVGPLVIFIYFHKCFMALGCSLANLFELATDQQIAQGPNAVLAYGVQAEHLAAFGALPTVFYEDEKYCLLANRRIKEFLYKQNTLEQDKQPKE